MQECVLFCKIIHLFKPEYIIPYINSIFKQLDENDRLIIKIICLLFIKENFTEKYTFRQEKRGEG